ncbi:methyl-accepting chemotaxis protein [uncultured Devosia sp.]|uniref:methyl-accepting chemotaxis protein n=1 Tax=uncultured Devosia sp. TaxID=211434 RepID=UPI0035CC9EF8
MGKALGKVLVNLKLTSAIAAMVISAILLSIAAVLLGLWISLAGTTRETATAAIASSTRIAAQILAYNLPNLGIVADGSGDVTDLSINMMRKFRSHDVIDGIAGVTREPVSLYLLDPAAPDNLQVNTTSFMDGTGERRLDAPIAKGTPMFEALAGGQAVRQEETIAGIGYFTRYQPIRMENGTLIGALQVAVAKAPVEAVVGRTMTMLLVVGGVALAVTGGLALLLSQRLSRPVRRLSSVMGAMAAGALQTHVPYTDRRNEMGAMARAVEVFRSNSLRMAELGEQSGKHLERAADHAGQLSAISASQLVVEFTLAGEVRTVNQNLLDLLGYDAEAVQGQPNALFLFDADPQSESYKSFWRELAGGAFKSGEYRRRRRDGREVWIQSTFTPILGVDGVPYKIVQFATDVTARKQAVAAVGAGLAKLAAGDLSSRLETPFQTEFEGLRTALNDTVDKFGAVVGQLKTTSRSLKIATGEILSGANDLSERTTRQAATIEETAAVMEQLAATVARNAKLAHQASLDAGLVAKSAEEGGAVMEQANAAMLGIETSSGKISNIIGLIDDIAFQTNLLALNASVEAARAGDAGKGFAVVAVEVRRLAQSAAGASADIKRLIEQSASEVAQGSRLVADAAARLQTMLERTRANTATMDTMARENQEQVVAIGEVSVAVNTLDEMTQHNAALVEQTNAALEQTEAEATALDQIVAVFTLAGSQTGSVKARLAA